MSGILPQAPQIRTKLVDAVAEERRDSLVFSVLTVLLTPAFIVLSVFILLIAVNQTTTSRESPLWNPQAFIGGTTVFLAVSCAGFFVRRADQPGLDPRDLLWLGLGVCSLAIQFCFSSASTLRAEHPRSFWSAYLGLTILTLGFLGRGYVPRDHYYVRPGEWSIADPDSRRQAEEMEFWFGFASAFPGLILGSYGNIFGSWWLWHGLGDRGLWVAAEVLHSLGARDSKAAESQLHSVGAKESGRILRWLVRLEYVRLVGREFQLTSQGERFLGISEWTV